MKYFTLLLILISLSACHHKPKFNPDKYLHDKAQLAHLTVGRYKLVQLSQYRRDQFLIDTATGNLWRFTCDYQSPHSKPGDCALGAWEQEQVVGINTTDKALMQMASIMREADHSKKHK